MIATSAGFAILLAISSWRKFRDIDAFHAVLAGYRLLPGALSRAGAWGVALVEAGLASMWIVASWLTVAATVAGAGTASLMLLYGTSMAANLLRGRSWIDCGCGGAEQLSWVLVARNLVLAAVAVLPLAIIDHAPPSWSDAAVSLPILAVAVSLYLVTGTLLRNATDLRVASTSQ